MLMKIGDSRCARCRYFPGIASRFVRLFRYVIPIITGITQPTLIHALLY
ncbi:hypothetical protein [Leclercia adecarboxylata]|nr:hypothetical protein [Leclercia adecarboxylata]